jgi:hypothetical protein
MSLTGYSNEMRLSITLMSCFFKLTDHEKQNSFTYCPRNLHLGCVPTQERPRLRSNAGAWERSKLGTSQNPRDQVV